jgi:hypothetical protein
MIMAVEITNWKTTRPLRKRLLLESPVGAEPLSTLRILKEERKKDG